MIATNQPAARVNLTTPDDLETRADAADVGVTIAGGMYYAVIPGEPAEVWGAVVPVGERVA